MNPVRDLMIETLRTVRPSPFRAAVIRLSASGPAWGVWHHVHEIRWLLLPTGDYQRSIIDTGYWPSDLQQAREWAAAHVAPPPFIEEPCWPADPYCEQTMMHDLRFFASCPRVLDCCPWLPERLSALEVLSQLT